MKKFFLMFCLLPSFGFSQYFTDAETLYQNCNSNDLEKKTFCIGFVGAVFDGLIRETDINKAINRSDDPSYTRCNFNKVTSLSQVTDVVHQWLKENPRKRADSAEAVTGDVLTVWLECGSKRSIEFLKENGY